MCQFRVVVPLVVDQGTDGTDADITRGALERDVLLFYLVLGAKLLLGFVHSFDMF